jgi:hypothetical protein
MSPQEKVAFVSGFRYGAEGSTSPLVNGTLPSCPTPFVSGKWYVLTSEALVQAVEEFYQSTTNIPLPAPVAIIYNLMKTNGATKQQLDNYRSEQLRAFVR